MKFIKVIFYCFVLLVIYSCKDETLVLKERIKQLEIENEILKSNLKKKEYDMLISSQLILTPHRLFLKLNSKNRVSGYFYQNESYPKFDLYFTNDKGEYKDSDKIDYVLKKNNQFEFDFIPKSKNDEDIHVMAIFDLDTVRMRFPGEAHLPVK